METDKDKITHSMEREALKFVSQPISTQAIQIMPSSAFNHLGDIYIQNFHLGRYIVGYIVGNLVLR